jgi:hypothetical protein
MRGFKNSTKTQSGHGPVKDGSTRDAEYGDFALSAKAAKTTPRAKSVPVAPKKPMIDTLNGTNGYKRGGRVGC